ncbi:MAG: hypothetical protein GY714_01010 [Desulfobacterales bacterium]|nr:hypothetical protein [Desulfobacterales bacterium]
MARSRPFPLFFSLFFEFCQTFIEKILKILKIFRKIPAKVLHMVPKTIFSRNPWQFSEARPPELSLISSVPCFFFIATHSSHRRKKCLKKLRSGYPPSEWHRACRAFVVQMSLRFPTLLNARITSKVNHADKVPDRFMVESEGVNEQNFTGKEYVRQKMKNMGHKLTYLSSDIQKKFHFIIVCNGNSIADRLPGQLQYVPFLDFPPLRKGRQKNCFFSH